MRKFYIVYNAYSLNSKEVVLPASIFVEIETDSPVGTVSKSDMYKIIGKAQEKAKQRGAVGGNKVVITTIQPLA